MQILVVETYSAEFSRLEGYLPLLTKHRRDKIAKKRSDEDKVNALVSELLLISEIGRRTGNPPNKISFCFGAHGKPYLKDSELYFSLSHTKGAVCAAFSESGETGVDIEPRFRTVSERLMSRVLSEEEMLHVTSSADFIRAWVCKEAFLKRTGIGAATDLRGVNSLRLPDTTALEYGYFFVGISGKGALEAKVERLPLQELLGREEFTLIKRNKLRIPLIQK